MQWWHILLVFSMFPVIAAVCLFFEWWDKRKERI